MPEDLAPETTTVAEPPPFETAEDVAAEDAAGEDPAAEDAAAEDVTAEDIAPEDVTVAAETPSLPESVVRELADLRQLLEESSGTLLRAFEDKLAFDSSKDKQIDALHDELQKHKRGLLAKMIRPLLVGLVRLHDDLGRMVEDLRREPPEELTPERFYDVLEGFQDDVEIVLEENGVSIFLEPGERFEPRRQTSRRTVESDDEQRIGTIARRVRPGFEQDETLLQKERVDVYVRRVAAPGEAALPAAE